MKNMCGSMFLTQLLGKVICILSSIEYFNKQTSCQAIRCQLYSPILQLKVRFILSYKRPKFNLRAMEMMGSNFTSLYLHRSFGYGYSQVLFCEISI